MLSASTVSSVSSSAFSVSPATSTPSSQYTTDSARKQPSNPLTELIETEKVYQETLKIIDSQIGPLWMKQSSITAPDFSELLKYVHDITKANKRFCTRLVKIAANPQAIRELGDVLMQWVDDMEVPYANFCRRFIVDLNQRRDILSNSSLQYLLDNLSENQSYQITLESLFNAPIQQLKYYKMLYNRLLESTDPGRADHRLLYKANKRIDTIMLMAQKASSRPVHAHPNESRIHNKATATLPHIRTNLQSEESEVTMFEGQVDCSRVVDIFSGSRMQYEMRLNPNSKIALRDNFILLPEQSSERPLRVHLVLTTNALIICQEQAGPKKFSLLYPPLIPNDITVKSTSLDRELVGEYIIQLSIGRKNILLRADSKEVRNTWVGVESGAPSSMTLKPRPLKVAVERQLTSLNFDEKTSVGKPVRTSIRSKDVVSFYTDKSGEISPLEDSDDEVPLGERSGASRDTIMDIYEGHMYDYSTTPEPLPSKNMPTEDINTIVPRSAKILPQVPNGPDGAKISPPLPKDDRKQPTVQSSAPVQMTFIQPVVPQKLTTVMTEASAAEPTDSISRSQGRLATVLPVVSKPDSNGDQLKTSPTGRFNPIPAKGQDAGSSRPVSPRPIEVRQAAPVAAMQAVTQANEYLTGGATVAAGRSVDPVQEQHSIHRSVSPSPGAAATYMPPQPSSMRAPGQQFPAGQPVQQGMSQRPHPSPRGPVPVNYGQQSAQQQNPDIHSQAHVRPLPSPGHHMVPPQQGTFRSPSPQPPYNAMSSPAMGRYPGPANGGPMATQNRSANNAPSPGYHQQPSATHPQQAGYFNMPPVQPSPTEGLGSPPHSPGYAGDTANDVRQVLHSTRECEAFHWKDQSWYAAEGRCLLQVRQMHSNRSCLTIQLQNTGQLYLNAWILPTTVIRQPSETDISISVFMGAKKENYLVHLHNLGEATRLASILHRIHQDAIHQQNLEQQQQQQQQQRLPQPSASLPREEERSVEDVPQTLAVVLQCKGKLFANNETSSWTPFGNVSMRISQQMPSKKMHIAIENEKAKLVAAIVRSSNVEKLGPKRITFLLTNEKERTSMVYMVQMREEQTINKIYEYLRTKNAENGW
ncbi:hypothetical protein DFQ28_011116 [Apophysomyces sp. BC1034]|nr:hypothetical protein DFQ30_007389 [Apophysomyces sp. BC1015]KAG0182738.1 hypothetical protein DFQ29_002373 [Apophysomyces sp. BC1021]KAG0191724.1 hypothetical protein DFQ28_011116 [Apophysomyces sp. BC1034]